MRDYFLTTERIGFSHWTKEDLPLARSLWGNGEVTKYICATGTFTDQQIQERLALEMENEDKFAVQYWPIFRLQSGEFLGCCGLRPFEKEEESYEMGIHLRPACWGAGLATEAANAVIAFAFSARSAANIFVGHHPENEGSRKLMKKLGFQYIGDHFYEPTQLYHPSYQYR